MKLLLISLISAISFNTLFGQKNQCLPCSFENDLIRCQVISPDGDSLEFYTDTGGKNYLYKSGKKKLGLKNKDVKGLVGLLKTQGFPFTEEKTFQIVSERKSREDGMLGREWFDGNCWFFDYVDEKLCLCNDNSSIGNERIPLSFAQDEHGNHTKNLPGIDVMIDGDTLHLLLDTGAQVNLPDSVQELLSSPKTIATSFINASFFDRWRKDHPDWRVIEKADISYKMNEALIEVPEIRIGSKTIGPVIFTRRADVNFETMSIYFMGKPIQGAIGGNALSQLGRFWVDYRNEVLWF